MWYIVLLQRSRHLCSSFLNIRSSTRRTVQLTYYSILQVFSDRIFMWIKRRNILDDREIDLIFFRRFQLVCYHIAVLDVLVSDVFNQLYLHEYLFYILVVVFALHIAQFFLSSWASPLLLHCAESFTCFWTYLLRVCLIYYTMKLFRYSFWQQILRTKSNTSCINEHIEEKIILWYIIVLMV